MSARALGLAASPARLGVWPRHLLALAFVVAAMLAMFARDAGAIVAIWWGSSSYEHCLVVVPLLGWLVWLRRTSLAMVTPAGWAPPLLWVAGGAAGWLLGQAGGVAVARHLGLAMMLQGAVAVLLGPSATRILLFPLGYALFLVPVGDALVPPLQTITARMTIAMLHFARAPATLDGIFITTPAGWFRVAEACSGAKFLIAMAALGTLVAHLGFATWRRRLPFLALCLVAPVLANGVRAFLTVWVAQHRGAVAADGFDHVVYGWVFFAVVIAAVLAVSWRFFDRAPDAVPAPRLISGTPIALPIAAAAVVLLAGSAQAWASVVGGQERPISVAARLPMVAGWAAVPMKVAGWRPRFDGADRLLLGRYRDAAGREVDLAAALYARQGEGRELVGYGHGAADPDGDWSWTADVAAPPGWRGERIEGPRAAVREVATSYVVGTGATGSTTWVKLATLRVRLLGGDPRAMALLVSSERGRGSRAAVDAFVRAIGDPAAAALRIADGR